MNKLKQFLKESRQEVKKVTWPKKEETFKNSAMVVIASLIVAAYLGGIDYLVRNILEGFI